MSINFNGQILSDNQPIFTAGNRSFRYGDGLFESIRVFDGRMPFFDRHWERLSAGMAYLKMDVPSFFTPIFVQDEINKLTERRGNWRIRFSTWRAGGGLYTPETNRPEFLIEATPLVASAFELNDVGLKVGIFDQPLLSVQTLQIFKTTSALPFVLASINKKQAHWDDCLMLNNAGRIACGASSNVFFVKNHQLFTPFMSEGCVIGTMRAIVLDLAKKAEIRINESPIEIASLGEMDEIFLTNAVQGIRWVGEADGLDKAFSNTISKFLLNEINKMVLGLLTKK